MRLDTDEYYDIINSGQKVWHTSMAASLASILRTDEMLAALSQLQEMGDADTRAIAQLDFTTQSGIARAIELQGRIRGIGDVIGRLTDLANEETRDE